MIIFFFEYPGTAQDISTFKNWTKNKKTASKTKMFSLYLFISWKKIKNFFGKIQSAYISTVINISKFFTKIGDKKVLLALVGNIFPFLNLCGDCGCYKRQQGPLKAVEMVYKYKVGYQLFLFKSRYILVFFENVHIFLLNVAFHTMKDC